mgnify:FL=1|tara:strand:+ start:2830 stop:3813 length:984 start_codon:yes stop_codon:yes gene_type:complete
MNFQNLLLTKDNSLILLIRIYYAIALLLVLTTLTSLVFNQNIYYKETKVLYPNNNSKNENFDQTLDKLYTAKLIEEKYISKDINLELILETNIVPNIIISKLPSNIKTLQSAEKRKSIFIKIVLPIIIKENEKLALLNNKIRNLGKRIDFISRSDAKWLLSQMKEYKLKEYSVDELLQKVDKIPVSLALAQAVIESGWGTSRFAIEGNALYGQYIWDQNKDGIVPENRDLGEIYKIKSFATLSDSVSSYMKNLNTNYHYSEFRLNRYIMRNNNLPLDGITLSNYLYNYSIEDEYSDKVKNIIKTNKFEEFEHLKIEKQNKIKLTEII